MNPRSLNEQDPLPKLGERVVPTPPPEPPDFVATERPGVYKDRHGKLFTMVLENERAPEDWVAAERTRRWIICDDLQEGTREHDNGLGQWLTEHKAHQKRASR